MTKYNRGTDWYSATNKRRHRKNTMLTLTEEVRQKLTRLAKRYGSKSAAVEALVLAADE